MKIDQEVIVREDFKINTRVSERVMTVKKGEKGSIRTALEKTTSSLSCRTMALMTRSL